MAIRPPELLVITTTIPRPGMQIPRLLLRRTTVARRLATPLAIPLILMPTEAIPRPGIILLRRTTVARILLTAPLAIPLLLITKEAGPS